MPKPACPYTGLNKRMLDDLYEPAKGRDGKFNPAAFPGCNIYNVRSMSAAAGFKGPDYFLKNILLSTSSLFHVVEYPFDWVDDDGEVHWDTIYATHTDSAEAGGKAWRDYQKDEARNRANTGRTDTSPANLGSSEDHWRKDE